VQPMHGEHGRVLLRFSLDPQLHSLPLGRGQEYVLSPRFIDPNSRTLADRLLGDAPATRPLSVRLMREHPATFRVTAPAPPDAASAAFDEQLRSLFPLTPSQEELFCLSRQNAVQCVNGPPGSGKTYFSAALICRLLVRALLVPGAVQRVLVTAFTHAAIDNLLNKVAELLGGRAVLAFAAEAAIELPVPRKFQRDDSKEFTVGCEVQHTDAGRYYVEEIRENGFLIRPVGGGGEQVVGASEIRRWRAFSLLSTDKKQQQRLEDELRRRVLLLGCTCYQTPKVRESLAAKFDFLLVDEASQMLLTHLSMSLPLLQDLCPAALPAGSWLSATQSRWAHS